MEYKCHVLSLTLLIEGQHLYIKNKSINHSLIIIILLNILVGLWFSNHLQQMLLKSNPTPPARAIHI